MLYLYHAQAGNSSLVLDGDAHRYVFKVRRHKVEETIYLRSLDDTLLHRYFITHIDKKSAHLILQESLSHEIKASKYLHIAWCMIDVKSIEKVLPSLSEMGVSKISFISCERSQKNFKLDMKRFERILEASMQQSGRSVPMEFDTYKNIKDFIEAFPQTKVFDFTDKVLSDYSNIETVLIGCEGGFSATERPFCFNPS